MDKVKNVVMNLDDVQPPVKIMSDSEVFWDLWGDIKKGESVFAEFYEFIQEFQSQSIEVYAITNLMLKVCFQYKNRKIFDIKVNISVSYDFYIETYMN